MLVTVWKHVDSKQLIFRYVCRMGNERSWLVFSAERRKDRFRDTKCRRLRTNLGTVDTIFSTMKGNQVEWVCFLECGTVCRRKIVLSDTLRFYWSCSSHTLIKQTSNTLFTLVLKQCSMNINKENCFSTLHSKMEILTFVDKINWHLV